MQWKIEPIIVQRIINHGLEHVGENVVAQKHKAIFDNDDTEVDELVHNESDDRVLVIQNRL